MLFQRCKEEQCASPGPGDRYEDHGNCIDHENDDEDDFNDNIKDDDDDIQ